MGADTKIEWTHHTFNPWWGCEKVSPGCAHCYADTFAKRVGQKVWGADAPRRFFGDKHWAEPLKWNRYAEKAGKRRRVFCASMADVFEDRTDLRDARATLFHTIGATPHLDWLLLTKRPENIARLWAEATAFPPPWPNVWLGTTVEDQQRADERIPKLLAVPAAVRFLSVEPLLGPVDLRFHLGIAENHDDLRGGIGWVIVGGESGPGARPMHPAWARSIRDQCRAAGVAFFFKQQGAWTPRRPDRYCQLTSRRWSHESVAIFEDGSLYLADRPDTWGANGMETLYRTASHNGDPAEWPEDLRVREFPANHRADS